MTPESRKVKPEETSTVRQWLDKKVCAATDMQAKLEKLLKTMFSIRFVQRGYKEEFI
jgi:hypothetical protein